MRVRPSRFADLEKPCPADRCIAKNKAKLSQRKYKWIHVLFMVLVYYEEKWYVSLYQKELDDFLGKY